MLYRLFKDDLEGFEPSILKIIHQQKYLDLNILKFIIIMF